MKQGRTSVKLLTTVTFLVMVVVNILANTLPINGVNSGEVSDSYPNLFAPAGLTFVIWGLIYFLLALYTFYQLGLFQKNSKRTNSGLLDKVDILFSVSSIANAAWIFSWHYHIIALSMALIVVMLICLILIHHEINHTLLSRRDQIFIRLPFSVYFGWLTVATIANATVLLVSIGWNGFGIPETLWTIVIIAVGLVIGTVTMIRNRDMAYGLVIIWAYTGIMLKHISASGFGGQYPIVITVVAVSIGILLIAEGYLIFSKPRWNIG